MKISVIGTGYVGLVTGTCFAEVGNDVTCIDIDTKKVAHMKKGKIPIYEPGLEKIFTRTIAEGRLRFTDNLASGIKDTELIFLALPTPPGEDGSADLSYVLGVAEKLGHLLESYTVIVNKSTVPVGTTHKIKEQIAQHATVHFDVASNPEFLREGLAVNDFMKPDRVVVGTTSKKVRGIMEHLYAPFVDDKKSILFMDEHSAEMTKYAANSFLATKISFMNEIAILCEKAGANVDDVRIGIGSDPRIGQKFLFPGIGYGGSCFPKDVKALHYTSLAYEAEPRILAAVMATNEAQKKHLQRRILDYYKNDIAGKTFALWGLAFKPDTDDIREAPALEIIADLTNAGAHIVAYDPQAMDNVKRLLGGNKNLSFVATAYDALKNADALLVATEWAEFRASDLDTVKKSLAHPVIFDGRNIFDLDYIEDKGLHYESIGRNTIYG